MGYVRASKEMPFLTDAEIDQKAREYGFVSEDEEAGQMDAARFGEKKSELAGNQGAVIA